MKISPKVLALLLTVFAGACTVQQREAPQPRAAAGSYQLFYDELSPYGTWVEYPAYGYVWLPNVERDFTPYGTNGHWVYSDNGWLWVSGYPWGWAVFHYGRWAYDDLYGWFWVPQNEWGPAWVVWRRSAGYYGWAPMGPGVTVETSFGREYRVPEDRWLFVPEREFGRPDIGRYYVDRSTNITIINNSTVINRTYSDAGRHTVYTAGPDRNEVERITRTGVRPVTIQDNDRPDQTLSNDRLRIYRPQVEPGSPDGHKAAPTRVVGLQDVRRTSGRNPGAPQPIGTPPGNPGQGLQSPDSHPTGIKAKRDEPRIVTPPDRNTGREQPPERRDTRPTDSKGREVPWVGNPPAKNADSPPAPGKPRAPEIRRQPPQPPAPPALKGKGPPAHPPKTNRPKKADRKPAPGQPKLPEPPKNEIPDSNNHR
jgi:hypothetical protein